MASYREKLMRYLDSTFEIALENVGYFVWSIFLWTPEIRQYLLLRSWISEHLDDLLIKKGDLNDSPIIKNNNP